MNSELKSLLIKTFGSISCLIVIFFFVTFVLFQHNEIKDSLKESWSATISFASVLATVGAAIIASNLFNDWRVQETGIFKRNLAHTIYNDMGAILTIITTPKYEKHTVDELQFLFNRVNYNLILYTKYEPKIRDVIKPFALVYIKQLGYFEREKNKTSNISPSEKNKFMSEYGLILHSIAELVELDRPSNDTDLIVNTIKAAIYQDPKYLEEETKQFIGEIKSHINNKKHKPV